jgi:hypothetical protein
MEIPSDVTRQLVETSSVKEAVLFANTPSFLMQRLRRDSATSYLAQALTMRESIDVGGYPPDSGSPYRLWFGFGLR